MNVSAARVSARLPELDLLRFTAAISVVIYHWTYRPLVDGAPSTTVFGPLQAISKFGYLGVDLFFMISGFVILWSADNRSAGSFLASRFSRLFPTFWLCVALTTIVLLNSGQAASEIDLRTFLVNLTMFPSLLGAHYIDVVYWTLLVELKFYFLIFLALLVLPWRAIEPAIYAWLAIAALTFCSMLLGSESVAFRIIKSLTIVPYAPLFIAGATYFFIWRDGPTRARFTAIIICLVLAVANAINQQPDFVKDISVASQNVTIAITVAQFLIFLVVALKLWQLPTTPLWRYLGALTYPLYLLHNMIGKTIWSALPDSVGPWAKLLALALGVGLLTWAVTAISERRWAPQLNAMLQDAIMRRKRLAP